MGERELDGNVMPSLNKGEIMWRKNEIIWSKGSLKEKYKRLLKGQKLKRKEKS